MRLFIFFIGFLGTLSLQAQIGVDVAVTTENPGVGEKFKVTYYLKMKGNGSVSSNSPTRYTPPTFEGFQVINETSGGTNFGFSNEIQLAHYEVTLKALKKGTFTIGPATFIFNKKPYESRSLTIKVGDKKNVPQDAGEKDLFVTLELSKRSAYQGEPIVASMKLYYRNGDFMQLEEMEIPEFNGFIKEEVAVSETGESKYLNGEVYTMHEVKRYILYAQKDGVYEVEPYTFSGIFRVRQRGGGMFSSYKKVKWEDSTPAYKITVNPLPAGRPSNYLGEFSNLRLNVKATPEELDMNQAITLNTTFSGSGNLKLLKELNLDFPSDFEVYDPKIQNNYSVNRNNISGSKGYEYVILTRSAGEFKIQIDAPSYFDYDEKIYKILSVPELNFKVNKGDGSSNGGNYTFDGKNEVNVLNQDVRYIKTNTDCLIYKDVRFFGSIKFYGLMSLPFLAFIVLLFANKRNTAMLEDKEGVKRKRALKMAKKHLNSAELLVDQDDSQAYYLELSRALYGYLSDKFGFTNFEMSKDNLRETINNHLPPKTVDDLMHTLDTCDMARYAPVSHISKKELFENARKVILESESSFSE